MTETAVGVQAQLDRITGRLIEDFADTVPESRLRDYVRFAMAELGSPRITTFVPVLVDRAVRERLRRASGEAAGPGPGHLPSDRGVRGESAGRDRSAATGAPARR